MEEKILYPSIGLKVFIPCLGLAGGIVGYHLFTGQEHFSYPLDNTYTQKGWGIFLLLGSLVITTLGLLKLLPSACFLKLDGDKLTTAIFFIRRELAWNDVSLFRTFRFRPSSPNRVVADVYENAASPLTRKLSTFSRNRYGIDFLLPCNYSMSAEDLMILLNEWRSRYGRPT
jgi:hypothetical protein